MNTENTDLELPTQAGAAEDVFNRWYAEKFKPAMERGPLDKYVARQAWFAGGRAADACATPEPVRPDPKVVIPKPVPKYEGEMAVREQRAQEQYELMKLRTAPVGNKMGYQYIPPGSLDEADITSGKTRRRS